MHEHGPDCLEGPIRGSQAWWRGLEPPPQADSADAGATAAGVTAAGANAGKPRKKKESGIREELVARIRGEIAAGTYDTPEKWQAALDRLLDRLDDD
jgi:hypothetical protein